MSKPYSTWFVKKEIGKYRNAVGRLSPMSVETVELESWEQAVKDFADNVFGDKNVFSETIVANVFIFSDSAMARRGALLKVLADMQKRIETADLPPKYYAPGVKGFQRALWAVFGTVMAALVFSFLSGNENSTTERQEPETKGAQPIDVPSDSTNVKVLLGDLHNWYKRDNLEVKNSFDSMLETNAQKLGLYSGAYFEAAEKFGMDWRVSRDYTIDSFFIRLEALGVETRDLGIKKKLPIDIGRALKKGLESLGFDQPRVDRIVFFLDTL